MKKHYEKCRQLFTGSQYSVGSTWFIFLSQKWCLLPMIPFVKILNFPINININKKSDLKLVYLVGSPATAVWGVNVGPDGISEWTRRSDNPDSSFSTNLRWTYYGRWEQSQIHSGAVNPGRYVKFLFGWALGRFREILIYWQPKEQLLWWMLTG